MKMISHANNGVLTMNMNLKRLILFKFTLIPGRFNKLGIRPKQFVRLGLIFGTQQENILFPPLKLRSEFIVFQV